ncbi:hypothetical protein DIPPA_22858 [Diplonema papillatum]|nr:hypothetical protein DIPPA_22858 [Diplonema papillatum]
MGCAHSQEDAGPRQGEASGPADDVDAKEWTAAEVQKWAKAAGLSPRLRQYLKRNGVDGQRLADLTTDDLPGIPPDLSGELLRRRGELFDAERSGPQDTRASAGGSPDAHRHQPTSITPGRSQTPPSPRGKAPTLVAALEGRASTGGSLDTERDQARGGRGPPSPRGKALALAEDRASTGGSPDTHRDQEGERGSPSPRGKALALAESRASAGGSPDTQQRDQRGAPPPAWEKALALAVLSEADGAAGGPESILAEKDRLLSSLLARGSSDGGRSAASSPARQQQRGGGSRSSSGSAGGRNPGGRANPRGEDFCSISSDSEAAAPSSRVQRQPAAGGGRKVAGPPPAKQPPAGTPRAADPAPTPLPPEDGAEAAEHERAAAAAGENTRNAGPPPAAAAARARNRRSLRAGGAAAGEAPRARVRGAVALGGVDLRQYHSRDEVQRRSFDQAVREDVAANVWRLTSGRIRIMSENVTGVDVDSIGGKVSFELAAKDETDTTELAGVVRRLMQRGVFDGTAMRRSCALHLGLVAEEQDRAVDEVPAWEASKIRSRRRSSTPLSPRPKYPIDYSSGDNDDDRLPSQKPNEPAHAFLFQVLDQSLGNLRRSTATTQAIDALLSQLHPAEHEQNERFNRERTHSITDAQVPPGPSEKKEMLPLYSRNMPVVDVPSPPFEEARTSSPYGGSAFHDNRVSRPVEQKEAPADLSLPTYSKNLRSPGAVSSVGRYQAASGSASRLSPRALGVSSPAALPHAFPGTPPATPGRVQQQPIFPHAHVVDQTLPFNSSLELSHDPCIQQSHQLLSPKRRPLDVRLPTLPLPLPPSPPHPNAATALPSTGHGNPAPSSPRLRSPVLDCMPITARPGPATSAIESDVHPLSNAATYRGPATSQRAPIAYEDRDQFDEWKGFPDTARNHRKFNAAVNHREPTALEKDVAAGDLQYSNAPSGSPVNTATDHWVPNANCLYYDTSSGLPHTSIVKDPVSPNVFEDHHRYDGTMSGLHTCSIAKDPVAPNAFEDHHRYDGTASGLPQKNMMPARERTLLPQHGNPVLSTFGGPDPPVAPSRALFADESPAQSPAQYRMTERQRRKLQETDDIIAMLSRSLNVPNHR